jgi:hypothetical protein
MPAQHPSLLVEQTAAFPDDLWIECRDCGKANYLSRGPINHKRGCASSRAQYNAAGHVKTPAAQLDREISESARDQELKTFASNVRRTGLTKGRDQDTLDAVREGYLSEADAMNVDD